jgi:hypothetical protein
MRQSYDEQINECTPAGYVGRRNDVYRRDDCAEFTGNGSWFGGERCGDCGSRIYNSWIYGFRLGNAWVGERSGERYGKPTDDAGECDESCRSYRADDSKSECNKSDDGQQREWDGAG